MKPKVAIVALVAILAVVAAGCVGYVTFGPKHHAGPAQPEESPTIQTQDGSVAAGVSTQACAGLPPPPGWLAPEGQ
ncbi:MAG: hypothetical protein FJX74_01300 [Armatimonadetes bacterium]|nr:hypothetical protein [Armatimonadota bacterium]